MSTMQVGYYPINRNTAEHVYAIMNHNNKKYEFACYGGTNDTGNVFPANYYYDRSIWYTRSGAKTQHTTLDCHPQIAVHIAMFDSKINMNHFNYNRKSGGPMGLGDNSGIIYALTGVCHQMCNLIACATNINDPLNSFINWPPSLNASKIIYGNRGTGAIDSIMKKWIAELKKYYGISKNLDDGQLQASPLDEAFNIAKSSLIDNIKAELRDGFSSDTRRNHIENIIDSYLEDTKRVGEINVDEATKEIMDYDAKFMSNKKDLDNQLIRGQVSKLEYAENINKQSIVLTTRYVDVISSKVGTDTAEDEFRGANINVIDVNMMPESYEQIKELLGL